MTQLPKPDREAIARLLKIALRDTGQSRYVADFLLAWHNASENGGWDPTAMWALDSAIVGDMFVAIRVILAYRSYLPELGFKKEIEAVWELWRGPVATPEPDTRLNGFYTTVPPSQQRSRKS